MDLQLHMQSVPITTEDEVYSIQHYVIKFVSDLRQVGGFLRVLSFLSPIKLTAKTDITEILLKVALNTLTLTLHSNIDKILKTDCDTYKNGKLFLTSMGHCLE